MLGNLLKTIPPVTRMTIFLLGMSMILKHMGYLHHYDMYFSASKILQGEVIILNT